MYLDLWFNTNLIIVKNYVTQYWELFNKILLLFSKILVPILQIFIL